MFVGHTYFDIRFIKVATEDFAHIIIILSNTFDDCKLFLMIFEHLTIDTIAISSYSFTITKKNFYMFWILSFSSKF